MARLIDADALMKYIRNHDYQLVSRMGCVDKGMFTDGIEHGINIQPAVEVVHAKWEEWWPPKHMILTGEEMLYRCSSCTAKYADVGGYNYCPFCGAKMDA